MQIIINLQYSTFIMTFRYTGICKIDIAINVSSNYSFVHNTTYYIEGYVITFHSKSILLTELLYYDCDYLLQTIVISSKCAKKGVTGNRVGTMKILSSC